MNIVSAKTSLLSASEMRRGSMPRKEIKTLDLGARLLRECLKATTLQTSNYEIWSDSQTAIQWYFTKPLELRVFERNGVDHISKNTKGKLPRYIYTRVKILRTSQRDRIKSETKTVGTFE